VVLAEERTAELTVQARHGIVAKKEAFGERRIRQGQANFNSQSYQLDIFQCQWPRTFPVDVGKSIFLGAGRRDQDRTSFANDVRIGSKSRDGAPDEIYRTVTDNCFMKHLLMRFMSLLSFRRGDLQPKSRITAITN
jgi:hypothetical protein